MTAPLDVRPGETMAAYEGRVITRLYDLLDGDAGATLSALRELTNGGFPLAAAGESQVQVAADLIRNTMLAGEGSLSIGPPTDEIEMGEEQQEPAEEGPAAEEEPAAAPEEPLDVDDEPRVVRTRRHAARRGGG